MDVVVELRGTIHLTLLKRRIKEENIQYFESSPKIQNNQSCVQEAVVTAQYFKEEYRKQFHKAYDQQ